MSTGQWIGSGVGAVIGGIVGSLVPGVGTWTGIMVGLSLGMTIGMAIDPIEMDLGADPQKLEIELTTALEGIAIPDILGTNKLVGNIIWVGDVNAVPITAEQGGGKGGGGGDEVTVGFSYYMSWSVGICLGPVDMLHAVYNYQECVWSGRADRARSVDGQYTDIFVSGSEFTGTIRFWFGTDDQPEYRHLCYAQVGGPDEWGLVTHVDSPGDVPTIDGPPLEDVAGELHWAPEYGSWTESYYRPGGAYIGTSRRAPNLSFIVQRAPEYAFSPLEKVNYFDYNAPHAIWYLLTQYGKMDPSWLNDDSFAAAASTLRDELMGLGVMIRDDLDVLQYVEDVLRHINGVVRYSSDGTFHLKLLRGTESTGSMPHYTQDQMLEPPKMRRASWVETLNRFSVYYPKRIVSELPTKLVGGRWVFFALYPYSGKIKAWGSNYYGRMGINIGYGEDGYYSEWQRDGAFKEVWDDDGNIRWGDVCLTSDTSFAALDQNGDVYSWGNGVAGSCTHSLGLGDDQRGHVKKPTKIETLSNIAKLPQQGDSWWTHHCLVIDDNGDMWAWGENSQGQLGLGDQTDRCTPEKVPSSVEWQEVSCGNYHTLALDVNGDLWACGYQSLYALGDGEHTGAYKTTFQKCTVTTGLGTITKICCGYLWNMVLTAAGNAYVFGADYYGILGQDNYTPCCTTGAGCWVEISQPNPVLVGGSDAERYVNKVVDIFQGGQWDAGILLNSGRAYTWGDNNQWHLGNWGPEDIYNCRTSDEFDVHSGDEIYYVDKPWVLGKNYQWVQDIEWHILQFGLAHTAGIDVDGNIYNWGGIGHTNIPCKAEDYFTYWWGDVNVWPYHCPEKLMDWDAYDLCCEYYTLKVSGTDLSTWGPVIQNYRFSIKGLTSGETSYLQTYSIDVSRNYLILGHTMENYIIGETIQERYLGTPTGNTAIVDEVLWIYLD